MIIKLLISLFFVFSAPLLGANFSVKDAVITHQNKRPYQEDRFTKIMIEGSLFFGIYDGHGGAKTSSYLQEHLHNYFAESFEKMDNLFSQVNVEQAFDDAFLKSENYVLKNYKDGSTSLAVYIDKKHVLHCAWAGDTRLVVEKKGSVSFETKDHKPNDPQELKRIKSHGGDIEMHGVWRVCGLAVSRSIGDVNIKRKCPGQVIAIPECDNIQLNEDNHFAIIASDGLWDVISSEQAVKMVRDGLASNDTLDIIAQNLQNEAIAQGSNDNITICIIQFNWGRDKVLSVSYQKTTTITTPYFAVVQFFDWLKSKVW